MIRPSVSFLFMKLNILAFKKLFLKTFGDAVFEYFLKKEGTKIYVKK